MRARLFALSLVLLLSTAAVRAASFIVPDDLAFFKRADAVVVASPLCSYTRLTDAGSVQTVSTFAIEEVIKGAAGEHTACTSR